MDILYELFHYRMPEGTVPGDKVYIFTTGAYTRVIEREFNGFPPLKAVIYKYYKEVLINEVLTC
jgi:ornithine decarboxylase